MSLTGEAFNVTTAEEDGDAPWSWSWPSLIAAGVVSSSLYPLEMALHVGIVYYERHAPDLYRTLVNKAAAAVSFYSAVCLSAFFVVAAGLFLLPGGLLRWLCWAAKFTISAAGVQVGG